MSEHLRKIRDRVAVDWYVRFDGDGDEATGDILWLLNRVEELESERDDARSAVRALQNIESIHGARAVTTKAISRFATLDQRPWKDIPAFLEYDAARREAEEKTRA